MKKNFKLFCFFILISFVAHGDETLLDLKQQLDRIDRDISDLQKEIFTNTISHSNSNNIENNSSEISVFDMRLRDIENELKNINLNYENLSFEIDELKLLFEELSLKLNTSFINNEEKVDNEINLEIDQENQSNEMNSLGTLKINSEDLSNTDNTLAEIDDQNIDQKLTPEEQFQIAFDLLRSQKFNDAILALESFIAEHPSEYLAGSAQYWLGEIYLLKKENREAALVFAEGYQKYPKSIKAPNILYKLAEALIKIEKNIEACDTLNQFILKYPNHDLIEKAESKINEIKCS